jgi:hypothetical protein
MFAQVPHLSSQLTDSDANASTSTTQRFSRAAQSLCYERNGLEVDIGGFPRNPRRRMTDIRVIAHEPSLGMGNLAPSPSTRIAPSALSVHQPYPTWLCWRCSWIWVAPVPSLLWLPELVLSANGGALRTHFAGDEAEASAS